MKSQKNVSSFPLSFHHNKTFFFSYLEDEINSGKFHIVISIKLGKDEEKDEKLSSFLLFAETMAAFDFVAFMCIVAFKMKRKLFSLLLALLADEGGVNGSKRKRSDKKEKFKKKQQRKKRDKENIFLTNFHFHFQDRNEKYTQ